MDGRRVRVGCEFVHWAVVDTPTVFQVQPGDEAPVAVLRQRSWSEPAVRSHGYTDLYGNRCLRLVLPAERSSFRYEALVA